MIKHHLSLSNRVQYSPNTENQIYSTPSICSVAIYPSAITMQLSFVIIIERLFFKTPDKQKIWASK